ncbi:hypothetical protein WN943_019652 [Citrus x changshan-huyou]
MSLLSSIGCFFFSFFPPQCTRGFISATAKVIASAFRNKRASGPQMSDQIGRPRASATRSRQKLRTKDAIPKWYQSSGMEQSIKQLEQTNASLSSGQQDLMAKMAYKLSISDGPIGRHTTFLVQQRNIMGRTIVSVLNINGIFPQPGTCVRHQLGGEWLGGNYLNHTRLDLFYAFLFVSSL